MTSFNLGGGFNSPQSDASSEISNLFPDITDDEIVFDSFDPTANLDTEDAVLRVAFNDNSDPYSPYTNAYFSVQEGAGGRKVFYGWLRTVDDNLSNPIEIPLISGMALIELADMISNVPGIVANVMNGYELSDVSDLMTSGTFEGTDQWAYFFSNLSLIDINPTITSDIKPLIKYYLTSAEPNLIQSNPTQSLGGFISPSEVFQTTKLTKSISFDDRQIDLENNSLNSYNLIQIQDEIIEVEYWTGTTAIVAHRNVLDTPLRVHFTGAVVKGLKKNSIFSSGFSKSGKQYRCIAIRNDSDSLNAKKAKVYIKIPSRNNKSRWNVSIEIPRSEYKALVATNGSLNSVVDNSIANSLPADHYVTAPVVFTGGQNSGQVRIVSSYDGITGTFSFDEDLPYIPRNGDEFYVDTAPAQIIPNGITSPKLETNGGAQISAPYLISDFGNATGFSSGISIDILGQRENAERSSATLGPKEAIYVWIERELDEDNAGQDNNRLALTLEFSKV